MTGGALKCALTKAALPSRRGARTIRPPLSRCPPAEGPGCTRHFLAINPARWPQGRCHPRASA
jgi:hypothetical protein